MRISVLIATKNRKEPLRKALESVVKQKHKSFEIIVSDDASDALNVKTDVIDVIKTKKEIRYDRSKISRGVARARDHLMTMAKGDILVFLDDDAWFETSDCLQKIDRAFKDNDDTAVIAPKIIFTEHGKTGLQIPFSRFNLAIAPHISHVPGTVSYYVGACHGIRKTAIDTCGGYFGFSKWGEEELDLSYRVIESGLSLHYAPDITVHHKPEPSLIGDKIAKQKKKKHGEIYHHTKNRFCLAYRYLPALYIPSYMTVWLGRYGVRAVFKGAFGDFIGGVKDGYKEMKSLKRTVLSPRTIAYLKQNHGRLWY